MDFVWYAFEIYAKRLILYYEEIRKANPTKTVLIIEDNVPLYHKARRLIAPLLTEKNVLFLDHLPKSPDLHPIEHLYKDEKRLSIEYRLTITNTRKVT